VGLARCILMRGGSTNGIDSNGDTVFIDRKGGRMARMWQWWGNTEGRLVLSVHMGKKSIAMQTMCTECKKEEEKLLCVLV